MAIIESLLADFDHDGHVGSSEIQLIKDNLHNIFDIDASGGIDTKEIEDMVTSASKNSCLAERVEADAVIVLD